MNKFLLHSIIYPKLRFLKLFSLSQLIEMYVFRHIFRLLEKVFGCCGMQEQEEKELQGLGEVQQKENEDQRVYRGVKATEEEAGEVQQEENSGQ